VGVDIVGNLYFVEVRRTLAEYFEVKILNVVLLVWRRNGLLLFAILDSVQERERLLGQLISFSFHLVLHTADMGFRTA
jgi:hypothetical protein